jgi:DNA-directed RNA polymerase specialized sigma24 family protein
MNMYYANQPSEQELLEITQVIKVVSIGFVFGHNSLEDIRQECWVHALKSYPNWDRKRNLSAYIYTVLRTRMINYVRDTYRQSKPPCARCPLKDLSFKSECSMYEDKDECLKYKEWARTNKVKMSLNHLSGSNGADRIVRGEFGALDSDDFLESVFSSLAPDEAEALRAFISSKSNSTKSIKHLLPKLRDILNAAETE